MTTSASWDYSRTAAQIIQSAYEDLLVIVPGGTVAAADSTMALSRLNMIVKQYQGRSDGAPGMPIHTRQRVTLFLAIGQQSYLVGPAATDSRASTQAGRTTISNDEAAGQTVLSITANTDVNSYPGTTLTMTNGDVIGIELNDGTIQWTTISGTPGVTATVSVALTAAASAGNYVWWFTSRAQRFPHIEFAVLRDENRNDTPLGIYTQAQEYEAVVDKYADGDPTTILVEPLRLNTRITLNSQPNDITKQIYMTVLYPSEDYDATTDDIAYPQEAYRFLSWELAFALSPSVGRWTVEMEKNRNEARAMYLGLNPENSTLHFQCNA
jgi:hypothetical protein